MNSSNFFNTSDKNISSDDWHIFLRFYVPYIVLGLWSAMSNVFLSIVILKNKQLREKYLLLAAHALGNFCLGSGSLLAGSARLVYLSQGVHNVAVSHIDCMLRPWNWLFVLASHIPIVLSTLIAFERFACVAAPIKYYQIPSKRYIKFACFSALFYSLVSSAVAFPTAYVLEDEVPNICFTEDSISYIYGLYLYGIETVCGFLTVIFYVSAVICIFFSGKRSKMNEAAKSRLKAQTKITAMMAAVLLAQFFLSVLPNILIFITILFEVKFEFLSIVIPFCGIAATANSGLNIIYYTLFSSELRPAFVLALGMKCINTKVFASSTMK